MYLNKAIIIGNITRDPELKALPTGIKVASFSVATNRVWKDTNGAKQEAVEYHNIVVFGKQAEATAQYMKKGSQILVEGRIQTRSWEDKNSGEKKYRTEIVAENVQFGNKLNSKSESQEVEDKEPTVKLDEEYPDENINVNDIPF